MNARAIRRTYLVAIIFIVVAARAAFAGDDWKPIEPVLLAMKTAMVEPDSDAEAIFWEVHVEDQAEDLVFTNYVRIKIFNDRGKESHGQVDILFSGKTRVSEIAGRTIKADGTILELKKDAIFERTIVKASGLKRKAKSFAMPGVEPGSIIEYRWRETFPQASANNVRLEFQRDIPVQLVKYYIKPFGFISQGMRAQTFNGKDPVFTRESNGFYSTQMVNMPAFHDEPHMPPEDQVRAWTLLYYTRDTSEKPVDYWRKLGKAVYDELKPMVKANDDVKKAAAQIVGDATTADEKLQRLYTYCQTKIKNVNDDANGITAEEKKKVKKNDSPADTLKHGIGTASDIDALFAALATASGFEARIALLGDRGRMFADFSFTSAVFVDNAVVAVKVGADWRFFEPSSAYCPFGMLPWRLEAERALISDSKDPIFVQTPLSAAEKTLEKRTATLKLDGDGTLEGDASIEYTGQIAIEKKEEYDASSSAEREQGLRDLIKAQMSTAELSEIKVENVTDAAKPFLYRFHLRVPGYAQRTGKRLFIQPAFFQKGIGTLFSGSTRRYEIYFHYPWVEEDTVTIDLPAGFTLDSADSPGPFKAGEVASYDVKMSVAGKDEQFIYKRTWKFDALIFKPETYAGIKQVFDVVHERDNHTITLKQKATNQ